MMQNFDVLGRQILNNTVYPSHNHQYIMLLIGWIDGIVGGLICRFLIAIEGEKVNFCNY